MVVLVISLLILIVLLLSGGPVAFAFAAAVLFMVIFFGYNPQFLLPYSFKRLQSLVLLAIPFFIIAGDIMESGNITRPLTDFVDSMVSRLRGGIGAVAAITNAIFGAISGSAAAAIVCIGSIMIPRLEEEGYPRGYATSLMTASAGLALLIPPSISMILYGWLTFTSVPACFLAGVIPGILLMSLFIIINWIMVGRYPTVRKPRPWGSIKQAAKEVGSAGWRALPALMMPVFILGSIYGGVATPTEASAVAVFLAIPLGFLVYRGLTSKGLVNALIKSGTTVGAIMIMFVFALMLGRVFVMENIPHQLTTFVMSVSESKYVLLLLVNAILFIFGMFMDDVTGMIIAAPLMLPVVRSIGITSVHFSAIITTNLTMGLMTPPMAPLVYLGQRIGRTTFTDMIKTSLLFVFAAYMPVVLLTTYLPPLAEFLPALVFGEKVLIPAY